MFSVLTLSSETLFVRTEHVCCVDAFSSARMVIHGFFGVGADFARPSPSCRPLASCCRAGRQHLRQKRVQRQFFLSDPRLPVLLQPQPVVQLQPKSAALGDDDVEELAVLKAALDKAQRRAEVPPLCAQIKAAEDFIQRATKRLTRHDEAIRAAEEVLTQAKKDRDLEVAALGQSKADFMRLQAETQKPTVPVG